MVEPLFSAPFASIPAVGSLVELGGSEGKHAAQVRRMRVGEAIQLSNGNGLRVRGVVQGVADKSLTIEVTSVEQEAAPATNFTLIQALAKGDRDELAIQAATELGATAIVPWQAERSISRWDAAKAAKGVQRWQIICDEAAKQSLRAFFPPVAQPQTTAGLVQAVSKYARVLVLDPTAGVGLSSVEIPAGSVAIVVGPEGGISPLELEQLEAAGAVRVRLGSEILRTSTAGVAAIAVLQAKLGAWN